MSAARPAAWAYLLALCLGTAVAYSVYQIPIQPTDTLEALDAAATAPSSWALLSYASTASSSTLRPMRFLQTRWLEQIAQATGWTYHAVFRGFHALLALALILLFARALRVTTLFDLGACGIALLVLIGLHTFLPMLHEAFPVNHYLEVALAALAVFVLADGEPSWITTAAIALLLVTALTLIESGVLVSLAVIACAAVGMRGIDRRSIVASIAILALYFVARRALHIEMPGIGGHGSGFGGVMYDANAVSDRFGHQKLAFRAYNVVSALLSVLFSEPRNGVFAFLVPKGQWSPGLVIHFISSILATGAIAWHLTTVRGRTRAQWTHRQRAMIVSLIMIIGSTPLAISYVKDDVLSTAGVFYAVAVFVSAQALIERSLDATRVRAAIVAVLLLAGGSAWAWRAAGLHYYLRISAHRTRGDWVQVRGQRDKDPVVQALVDQIMREALQPRTISGELLPRWGKRYWVE